MYELKWISETDPKVDVPPAHVAPGKRVAWGIAGLLVAAALAIAGYIVGKHLLPSPSARPLKHLTITVPSQNLGPIALSRDGSHLAYTGVHNGVVKLHLRSLGQPDVVPIEGTEGADSPIFSPDGQWIGFIADQKLLKVPVTGGRPIPICGLPSHKFNHTWSWGQDDTIVFESPSGLFRISSSGGTAEPLTEASPDGGGWSHYYPEFLPAGNSVLFVVSPGGLTEGQIAVASLETGEWRILLDGNRPGFSPTGHIVF